MHIVKRLKDRDLVITQYAQEAMDNMDMDDACSFIVDTIEDELSGYTDAEIIDILEDCYDHILQDQVVDVNVVIAQPLAEVIKEVVDFDNGFIIHDGTTSEGGTVVWMSPESVRTGDFKRLSNGHWTIVRDQVFDR